MRILISGVTSFLGLSVAKRLVASGHTVYGIVRENSRNREKVEGEKGITLLSLDVRNGGGREGEAFVYPHFRYGLSFCLGWGGFCRPK